jgi:hypothetical protein
MFESLEPRQLLTASILPDLTVGVVSSVTGNFVGGSPGNIIVSIGNDGSELAIGTELVQIYVSPDNSVQDGTLITAVQETTKLSGGASADFDIPFLFPGISISGGRLIATVTPASQVIDSDATNDAAVGTSPVSITPPDADLEAQSVTLLGLPASGVVAGQKANALVTIKNVGNVLVSGPVHVNLLAANDTAGDGAISMVPSPVTRNINLAPNAFIVIPIAGTIPNVEGSEIVLASVDSSSATLETNLANNTVAAADPVQVSAAEVSLSDQIITDPPLSVVSGSQGNESVRVFNDGNVTFRGNVPISIYTSLDTVLDSGDERIVKSNRNAIIPAGKYQDLVVGFSYPTDLPDDNYFLLSQIGATTTAFRGVFSSAPIAVAASDASPSPTVVNISLPFVTLTPVFGTLPGTAFTAGQNLVLPLNLINSGNIVASGEYSISILASPSSDPNDPGAITLMPSVKRHLFMKSNSTMVLAFGVKIPSTLEAGVNYSFIATVVAYDVPGITDPTPAAVSAQTFLLTG